MSGLEGKGDLTVYTNKTTFNGDVDVSQNKVSCKTLTLNGNDVTSIDDRYYTKTDSDDRYYSKTDSNSRYSTKT